MSGLPIQWPEGFVSHDRVRALANALEDEANKLYSEAGKCQSSTAGSILTAQSIVLDDVARRVRQLLASE